ncbi:LacI family DNA-binding transcriptional regulator [uncultured Maritimibacter sp.]|jgi:LacI family transcriptional regulator|uniref:LacI family DNA-binding transcriptional regulator n=1 Tax=uncultured Maritimibacter sp. TaxID=991866 RepID=UPI002633D9B9|nr:LacI family DNA-binding transcriptional regulator [uncultured Maritimibacter sp.]
MVNRQPTLSDVARHAGVSYATADRVVNRRGNVAAKSLARVEASVAALGYVRNVAAANLSQSRTYRFVMVLPEGTNAFFGHMRDVIEAQRERLLPERFDLQVVTSPAFDPALLSETLAGLDPDMLDGVAVVAIDASEVVEAVQRLRGAGVPVITLVSDLGPDHRDGYIGIANDIAGRTAARMIRLAHLTRPAVVLPILGARTARDHGDRLAGLAEVLGDHTLLDVIEGQDRPDLVETKLSDALDRHPEITAIYSMGAGNAGLIRALDGRETRPMVILHELVPHSRIALEQGLIDVIIDQRPEEEIRQTVARLRDLADRRPPAPEPAILPTIYVKDNLPPPHGAASDMPPEGDHP